MKNLKILIFTLLFLQIQVYSQTKSKITFGGNAAYHIGTGIQKEGTSPLLFFKNGQSAGLDFMLFPKSGTTRYKLALDYITGSNDENVVVAYAKANNIEYDTYKFTKKNPGGFSIMASPQFMLFPKSQNKRLPLMWLDLKAGVLFSNKQNLEFYLGQTTPSTEVKTNAMSFVYSPALIVNVIKTSKIFVNLKASYSNFGGFGVGVSITEQDCRGAYCYRCAGVGCLGEMPDLTKK
ncbi:hypothetical protein [Flavobacterium restrictum]|uniref:Uncharacterized protein n=1 Tax=Flavobacterium restrictum TaxID=2594428 RepID=A0A553DU32_9FLAO|nr:hypothetical protein [Flavobacterium restrictum]TRX36249.1 hypothetical protein FNW21_13880 [Flavobacterium restrictum]